MSASSVSLLFSPSKEGTVLPLNQTKELKHKIGHRAAIFYIKAVKEIVLQLEPGLILLGIYNTQNML